MVRYDYFLFCNVGDDSEYPGTLDYFEKIALPFAQHHGLNLIQLRKTKRDGSIETLRGRIFSTARSVPIPARLSNGAPGNRTCTADFKIRVVAKWLRQHGATPDNPATTGLGISTDEIHRARTDSGIPHQMLEYPLIDRMLSRKDCIKIIQSAGLPVPPKSSCFFCPYHSPAEWMRLRREEPELFERAVEIDKRIRDKSISLKGEFTPIYQMTESGDFDESGYPILVSTGKIIGWRDEKQYLHPSLRPLEQAVGEQGVLFHETEICESGYCFV